MTYIDNLLADCPPHLADKAREFCISAERASYHHADDSGREWHLAKPFEHECQQIFDNASDELRSVLRRIKGSYLISIQEGA